MKTLNNHSTAQYFDCQSKFIIISLNTHSLKSIRIIGENLYKIGILNFIIYKRTISYSYNIFNDQVIQIKSLDLNEAFPNKLRNLHGFSFKVLLYPEENRVLWKNGQLFGPEISFLDQMTRDLSATFQISKNMSLIETSNLTNVLVELYRRDIDFCPNTRIIAVSAFHRIEIALQTFKTNAYCILIPKSQKTSFLLFMMSPFDRMTWSLIFISIIVGMIIFSAVKSKKLVKILYSGGYFLFAVYGIFLGQGPTIFKISSVKKFIFQLFVFFAFLFGAIYQSLIISFIFQNRDHQVIRSYEDLKSSNLKVVTDGLFHYLVNHTESNGDFMKRLIHVESIKQEEINKGKVALILSCEHINHHFDNDPNVSSVYYKVKGNIYPFYKVFMTRRSNPFTKRIQEYVSSFFESGITDYFERQFDLVQNWKVKSEQMEKNGNQIYLGFDDLYDTYYILLIGYCIASFVFVLEWLNFIIRKFYSRGF